MPDFPAWVIPEIRRLKTLAPSEKAGILTQLSQMPSSFWRAYLKALRGRSPMMAIRVQCLHCCGWNRREVAACRWAACPLYQHKPQFKETYGENGNSK